MTEYDTAVEWARIRANGPQLRPTGTAAPPGMTRLVEPDGSGVWLVAAPPEGTGMRVLPELGLRGLTLDKPNEAARVLACCLRCCWLNPLDPLWPSGSATLSQVEGLYAAIGGPRDAEAVHRLVVAALRQLDQSRWVLFDEHLNTIRLGPQVALWGDQDVSVLRQLWRGLPTPQAAP
ncbi:MAG: hypothetical protein ACRD0P_22715 [Stackebrandtia sp.]